MQSGQQVPNIVNIQIDINVTKIPWEASNLK